MVNFKSPLISGTLRKRYKRFLADIVLDNGSMVTAHCPNPGSMKSLAQEGEKVWLEERKSPNAKLPYSWKLSQLSDGTMVVVDTTLANKVILDALKKKVIPGLEMYSKIKSEVTFGSNSRLDFLLESDCGLLCYLEVKSISLAQDGIGLFPDSITKRGTKHLNDLNNIASQGHRSIMLFLIQRTDVFEWDLACDIDRDYCLAFSRAEKNGMEALAYTAHISTSSIEIGVEIFRRQG